jgi:CubicO group peptidase (beta-lactamase class C family)
MVAIMAALFALFATPCPAITAAAVDAIVKPVMDEAKIPGLAVSVSDGEDKLIDRAYGINNCR